MSLIILFKPVSRLTPASLQMSPADCHQLRGKAPDSETWGWRKWSSLSCQELLTTMGSTVDREGLLLPKLSRQII